MAKQVDVSGREKAYTITPEGIRLIIAAARVQEEVHASLDRCLNSDNPLYLCIEELAQGSLAELPSDVAIAAHVHTLVRYDLIREGKKLEEEYKSIQQLAGKSNG